MPLCPPPRRQPARASRWLAAAALLSLTGLAQAGLTVYTDSALFLAAVSGAGTDSFDNLPAGTSASPLARNAGSRGYSAEVLPDTRFVGTGVPPPGLFYAAGSAADGWLSTNSASDTLRFYNVGSANAVGGQFFGSDVDGAFLADVAILLAATDAAGTMTQLINSPTTGGFVGFVSDTTLLSLTVQAVQPAAGSAWASVNNLVLAQAVPEPASLAIALAGLGALALVRRKPAVPEADAHITR